MLYLTIQNTQATRIFKDTTVKVRLSGLQGTSLAQDYQKCPTFGYYYVQGS